MLKLAIVIPEGLSLINNKVNLSSASLAVFSECIRLSKTSDFIIIPGLSNTFFNENYQTESDLLFSNFNERGYRVIYKKLFQSGYVSTKDNVESVYPCYLELSTRFKISEVLVFTTDIHSARVVYWLRYYGFKSFRLVNCNYFIKGFEILPNRIFYYRFKFIHIFYENLLLILNRMLYG